MNIYPDMECSKCGEISFRHIDTLTAPGKVDILEYKCRKCGEYATFDDPAGKVNFKRYQDG